MTRKIISTCSPPIADCRRLTATGKETSSHQTNSRGLTAPGRVDVDYQSEPVSGGCNRRLLASGYSEMLILRLCLVLAVALLLHSAALGGVRVGDVEAGVQPLPSRDHRSGTPLGTTHGYVEFRVTLTNHSKEDRLVRLSYPPQDTDRWNFGVIATRTVRVAGGQTVAVSLYQPPLMVGDESLEVRVQGVKESKLIRATSTYQERGYGDTTRPAVLLGRGVPQEFRDGMQVDTNPFAPSAPSPPGGPSVVVASSESERFAFLRSELPVGRWSPNWLGYSGYDAIVVSGEEARRMPPRVRLALRRWVECGGTLLIHAETVPEEFSRAARADGLGYYTVGFGRVMASLADSANDWQATYKKLKFVRQPAYHPEERPNNLYDLLEAETTVPVRGLFVLVLMFGVGIGPVNLWLLSRYRRRIWLWWNVPAISLLTCLLVFGYSLASEGWTARGKTAGLTVLDERCHRATTVGYVSFYCPLTPSIGPRFDTETDVALLSNTAYGMYHYRPGSDTLRAVDWTNGQLLASGWIPARVPTYFQFRKNQDRRERIAVEKTADGLKIVNALGADIRALCLADAEGRVYEARDVPAGAARTLEPSDGKKASGGKAFIPGHISIASNWLHGIHELTEARDLSTLLAPGTYIAVLEDSPFVEKPLPEADVEDSAAIVYGISKGSQ